LAWLVQFQASAWAEPAQQALTAELIAVLRVHCFH
jgi:hypothetical protein